MKTLKKLLALFVTLAILISGFVACNQNGKNEESATDNASEISSSDPEGATTAADETTPDVTTAPNATSAPDVTTVPDVTTIPESTTSPEVTTSTEATTSPEVTTAPEVTTTPEVTTAETPVVTEPPHTHSYSSVWSKSATQHWHECACGDKADSAAHSFGEWVTIKAATETAQGSKKHTCTVCGFEETQAIPTLDHKHSFSTEWSKSDVQHWHECSCGEKKDQSAHSFGGWTVTKEPACSAEGSKKHVCTVCGYEETATIEKLAHTPAVDPAVPATCTEAGKTEGSHCSVCNAVLAVQQTVPATGHSFGEWNVTKAATCTEKGEEQSSCSVCHTTQSRDIDALGHNYVDTVVPPTATANGYTEHKCSRCNDSYRDNIVEATGSVGLAYRDNGDGTCTITGIGTCTDTYIYVPSKINNLTVIGIGELAFENQISIISLFLPDTITSIGRRAYYGCTNLKESNIPKNVNSIGSQPFFKSGIESIDYSSPLDFDETSAIFVGTPLKTISFDGDYVPSFVCFRCAFLTDVSISGDIIGIGGAAFKECPKLKNVTIRSNLEWIAGEAFYYCSSLEGISFPTSLQFIGSSAFAGCESISNLIIPNSVKEIGAEAFCGCKSLKTIELSDSISYLADSIFADCSSLESVTIPDSISSLGAHAFSFCSALKTITIPDSITEISYCSFMNCTSLSYISIPESVTKIGYCAFMDCSSLTNITIPNSVNTIEWDAFYKCTSLQHITIPSGVTSIDEVSFFGCSSLKSVFIPNSITEILGGAFRRCNVLSDIYYEGTISQWISISKIDSWNLETSTYIIHCTDGDITK